MRPVHKTRNILPDGEIIGLYWARDERAIACTADKYEKLLFHIANNVLTDRADCEECLNDTYLGIWNAIPPQRPAVFPAFISKIMRNIATDRYKHRMRSKRVPNALTVSLEEIGDTLSLGDTVDDERNAREIGDLINSYLKTLNDRQRYIFIGRYYMGDTLETIAAELHVNASTVHREVGRIRQGLKEHLERNGVYV